MEERLKDLLLWNAERAEKEEPILVPTFLAPTGAGKTWRAKKVYESLKEEVPRLRWARMLPGTMLPEEVLGLPKVTNKTTIWTHPDWVDSNDPVFLFIDELDKARPETLGSLLTLFAEYRIRDRKLPSGSILLAAMQPVTRGEWLADETGEAIGARLLYIPFNYAWDYVEDRCGLASGALSFLPTLNVPEPPVNECPSPRQVEYCISLLGFMGTDAKPFIEGIVAQQFVQPLMEAASSSPSIKSRNLLKAVEKDPSLINQLSIAELIQILPDSWFTTIPLATSIYKSILMRGNPEDIRAAQKNLYDKLKEAVDANGGKVEIFPGEDDPQVLADALNEMAKEVGQYWIKRAKEKNGSDRR